MLGSREEESDYMTTYFHREYLNFFRLLVRSDMLSLSLSLSLVLLVIRCVCSSMQRAYRTRKTPYPQSRIRMAWISVVRNNNFMYSIVVTLPGVYGDTFPHVATGKNY
jgi:hypothetical protein